jgi:2,3-bisphosphoglycerate-independent phosphoglycerate mutase
MKTIIIIGDGMADRPVDALGGKTPLMVANKPAIDRVASEGRVGLFTTIPQGQPNGSAVANLSVLGYDPAVTFQGRGVLEAAAMGVELGPDDVALRCNLISLDGRSIKNHSAGHIESEQGGELMAFLDERLGGGRRPSSQRDDDWREKPVRFYPGMSYRHLLVLEGDWASAEIRCAPPHDHVGEPVESLLPTALDTSDPKAKATAARLDGLYRQAQTLLAVHPINTARREQGLDCADAIWPWSPGRRPQMETMEERFGVRGAVISAVDLIKGLGRYAGMDIIEVEGATGLSDTNYEGKAEAAIDALEDHDMVYVHVEATDEAGHSKDLDLKIKCIEYLDRRLVGPILDTLESRSMEAAVAILPDHPTPVELGCHTSEPVPVAIKRPDWSPDDVSGYDELQVEPGSLGLLEGDAFIRLALGIS